MYVGYFKIFNVRILSSFKKIAHLVVLYVSCPKFIRMYKCSLFTQGYETIRESLSLAERQIKVNHVGGCTTKET